MNRRSILLAAAAWQFATDLRAEDRPWHARLVDGGFDGGDYWAGLDIEMSKGWKTYWRVPGGSGVPPQIEVTGANLESAELLFPVPRRFTDASGDAIGYKDKVVFPVRLTPKDGDAPLEAGFSAFFGVCEAVCIPARLEESLRFAMGSSLSADAALLAEWRDKLPVPSPDGPVKSVAATMLEGRPMLALGLARPVDDIFAEGPERYYFNIPEFEGLAARVPVSGASSADELKGKSIRFVSVTGGKGLEQTLAVG